MWLNSDGQSFGEQVISDANITFRTLWINHERSFTARIVVDSVVDRNNGLQFMMYLAMQVSDQKTDVQKEMMCEFCRIIHRFLLRQIIQAMDR